MDKLQNIASWKRDILSEKSKAAHTFNEFFSNVVKELKIEKDDNLLCDALEETDPELKVI